MNKEPKTMGYFKYQYHEEILNGKMNQKPISSSKKR